MYTKVVTSKNINTIKIVNDNTTTENKYLKIKINIKILKNITNTEFSIIAISS